MMDFSILTTAIFLFEGRLQKSLSHLDAKFVFFLAKGRPPGVSMGTMKALMPLCFMDLSVVAKATIPLAWWALVIQALVPFRTHLSPASLAVVEAAPASLPLPGSVRPKHPTLSPFKKGAR